MSKFPVQIHSSVKHEIIVGSSHFDDPFKAAEFTMKQKFATILGFTVADGSYWMAAVEGVMRAAQSRPNELMDLLMEYHERINTYKIALDAAKVQPVPGDAPPFPAQYNKDGPSVVLAKRRT